MRSNSAFMRHEGTLAAVRREMAKARASRSVTELFEHKIHVGPDVSSGRRSFAPLGR